MPTNDAASAMPDSGTTVSGKQKTHDNTEKKSHRTAAAAQVKLGRQYLSQNEEKNHSEVRKSVGINYGERVTPKNSYSSKNQTLLTKQIVARTLSLSVFCNTRISMMAAREIQALTVS